MANVEESGGGREINSEPNIIPFIDLMSVCIIFLLLTAVWTQVSMIQIGSSVYGKKTSEEDKPPPPPKVPMVLQVYNQGFVINLAGTRTNIPKIEDDEFDQRSLILALQDIKDKYPDKKDAMISVDEKLNYESLIIGMDSLLLSGFPDVTIQTGRVR